MDENTTTMENGTAADQQSAEQSGAEQPAAKTNEPDVSAIVARESRKAVEKLLREAGITPDDKPEMKLKEYKAWLDGQKTELETAQSTLADSIKQRDEALAQAAAMERIVLAAQKGVPGDKTAKYVKLAEAYLEGNDFGKALDAALTDFPIEKKGGAAAGANPGGATADTGNFGEKLARRKLEQQKKTLDALKNL